MTVEELISLLNALPQEARVEVEVSTYESGRGRRSLEEADIFTPLTVIYDRGVVTIALDEEETP